MDSEKKRFCESTDNDEPDWVFKVLEEAKTRKKPIICSFCFKKILGAVIWKNVLPACEICEEKLFNGVNLGLEEDLRAKAEKEGK